MPKGMLPVTEDPLDSAREINRRNWEQERAELTAREYAAAVERLYPGDRAAQYQHMRDNFEMVPVIGPDGKPKRAPDGSVYTYYRPKRSKLKEYNVERLSRMGLFNTLREQGRGPRYEF